MDSSKYLFDLYLGGPWEKYAAYPYKQTIKQAFPDKNIFDPETRGSQGTGDWFSDDCFGIINSYAMVAMVPDFPFPSVGPEAGMFYLNKNYSNKGEESIYKTLEELIIIWPKSVQPCRSKKFIGHLGQIVENPDEAVVLLKKVFDKRIGKH